MKISEILTESEQGVAEGTLNEFYDEKARKPEGGKLDRLVRRSLANKIPVFVLFDNKTTKSGYVQYEHPVKGFLVIVRGRKTYTTFNDETQKATKDGNRVYIQPRSMWNASRELDLDEGVAEDSMSLRDWFGKGKHGGAGGGGWDRYNTKGERIGKCGERKPGEGKPKCLSKAKAASLRASGGKKEIASAVNRKRREDPTPNRKGKADMVSNATRKKSNESIERGHYVHAFDGRDDAHEYLNKIRNCLEYSEGSLSESAPKWQDHQTPRQRVGIKNWHEIDRAYRQVNTKNTGDSLRLANLKFFSEDPRTLTRDEVESVWNFLKAFFRDQKNQRNQLQVYDALSTNRGIEQILAMSRPTVTEESDKFQQFIPSSTRWLVAYIPAGKRDPEYSYYNDDEEAALAADKLKRSGHKIIGIPVEVSKRTVQEGGKSRPLTIDDLKVYNLVVRPSEVQQRNPMFAATEKKWNSIGFRWTDNLRCYWMNKKQLLDPKKRKEVERFLGRSLNPDELPPMYIHKSQVPVSRRLGTYKD